MNHPNQPAADTKRQAQVLGLKQRTIAALLGASEQWVSIAIRRVEPPPRVIAIIEAWRIMTPAMRAQFLAATGNHRLLHGRQRTMTPHEDATVLRVIDGRGDCLERGPAAEPLRCPPVIRPLLVV
jgi:hypothetical protein